VPQIMLLFTDLGVSIGVIRFASSQRFSSDMGHVMRIIRDGMTFRLLVGIAVLIPSLIFSEFFASVFINRPNLSFFVLLASTSILFQVLFTTASSAFVGLDKAEYNALINNIQAAGKTIVSIILVLLGFGIAGAVIGYVGGFVVAGVVGGLIFLRLTRTAEDRNHGGSYRQTFGALTTYGLPLYVSTLVTGFLPLFSQITLAFFVSSAAVGNYRAASNFVALISVIPTSITTAVLPGFSKLDSSTSERIKIFFKRANKYTSMLIMPVVVLLMLFSRQVIEIIYGSTYETAWLFLLLSCIGYLLVATGYLVLSSLFNGLDDTKTTLKMTLVNTVVFIVLAPIFASRYDVPGVIIASLLASGITTMYGDYVAKKKFHVEFGIKASAKIYAVAGISTIPSFLLFYFAGSKSALILLLTGSIIYLIIYMTLIPLAKIITLDELKSVNLVIQNIKPLDKIAKPFVRYEKAILRLRSNPSSEEHSNPPA